MTNVNSGSGSGSGSGAGYKRTWDGHGADGEASKRARGGGGSGEPRDWRDVHLKGPPVAATVAAAHKAPPPPRSPGRGGVDRRGSGRRREDYRRAEYGRDRDRERDRERERGRHHSRERYRTHDDRPRSRSRTLPATSITTTTITATTTNGTTKPAEEEKEEGEISPPPESPKTSPAPSQRPKRPRSPSPAPPSRPTHKPTTRPGDAEMELDLPPSPPPVEDILAARRAKRLAILAKYNNGGTDSARASPVPAPGPSAGPITSSGPVTNANPAASTGASVGVAAGAGVGVGPPSASASQSLSLGPSSAVQPPPPSSAVSDAVSRTHSTDGGTPRPSGADSTLVGVPGLQSKRESMSTSPAPADFALAKDDSQEGDTDTQAARGAGAGEGEGEQVSAADYDPSLDRREDEQRRIREPGPAPANGAEVEVEEVEEEEEVEEDDVDDMFAVATSDKKKVKKVRKKRVLKPTAPALITTTLDSAADPEGYYTVILGEQLDGGRYQVFSSIGKGMFANVVRARVLQPEGGEVGREVAIKIVRCQDSMYRAGLKEVQILNKLKQADPEDKKHIVRLERTFEHRGHLCLVFESMSMNLRDVVKRFGKDVGLNIRAVRAYAHQLFLALSLLRKTNIMHADIKPDNILVNEQKTVLKLCDLGSASDASENEITPYLVSRFYRAPEIIMGAPYDPALDIWSIGCTLYELYSGRILFPGRSNNQMLLLMMELKGRFNGKMIKKAKFGDVYFDEMGGFESVERDRLTGNDVVRKVHISKPSRDLRARLMPPASVKMKDEESKMLTAFIDLLDKCLALDPARRITPREALAHPFVRG